MYLYHGTIKKYADIIIKEGFKDYTYFTPFLDSAINMGGEYVFSIYDKNVTDAMLGNGEWQFRLSGIKKDKIVSLIRYKAKLLYYDTDSHRKYFEDENTCKLCNGKGEIGHIDDGSWLLPRGSSFHSRKKGLVLCPECSKKNKSSD
ncbi:MAG: hypothetical protein ACRC4W_05285 [Treponemataceae bacterium]